MLDLYLRSHLKHGPHSIRSCLGRLAGFCVSIATIPALSQVGARPLVVRSGVPTRPYVIRAAKPLLAELGDRPRPCAYVGRCPREDQERGGSGATHTKPQRGFAALATYVQPLLLQALVADRRGVQKTSTTAQRRTQCNVPALSLYPLSRLFRIGILSTNQVRPE